MRTKTYALAGLPEGVTGRIEVTDHDVKTDWRDIVISFAAILLAGWLGCSWLYDIASVRDAELIMTKAAAGDAQFASDASAGRFLAQRSGRSYAWDIGIALALAVYLAVGPEYWRCFLRPGCPGCVVRTHVEIDRRYYYPGGRLNDADPPLVTVARPVDTTFPSEAASAA